MYISENVPEEFLMFFCDNKSRGETPEIPTNASLHNASDLEYLFTADLSKRFIDNGDKSSISSILDGRDDLSIIEVAMNVKNPLLKRIPSVFRLLE